MAFRYVPIRAAFLLLTWEFLLAAEEDSVVVTKSGPVRGSIDKLQGKDIFTFRNVPFAKPLTEELRFKAPEAVPTWTDVLNAATQESVSCPQIPDYPGPLGSTTLVGKEDCLVLDIYTKLLPQQTADANGLRPVLVYFHGGLFTYGSKNDYGPAFLLKENEFVLVIANYRLGVLGFLSTGDSDLPGNVGLLDQRMALKWVRENIGYFGGDAARVTIAGHDAGGVSVGLHILSPLSHEFFSGAISGSGTACDPWALTEDPRSAAMEFAKHVNCPGSPSRALAACLQKKSIETLLESQRALRDVTFRPVIDKFSPEPFIRDRPSRLYELGVQKNVAYLAGVTTDEASIEFNLKYPEMEKKKTLDDMLVYLLERHLQGKPNIASVVKAAIYQYTRGYDVSRINHQFSNLLSDFLYKSGLSRVMSLHSSVKSPGYMYVFEFSGSYSLGDMFSPKDRIIPFGVSHMDDVMYLFNTSFASWIDTDKSTRIVSFQETMNNIWGNFISQRDPSVTSSGTQSKLAWPRFQKTDQKYMQLSNSITVESNYRQELMDFWNELVPELQAVNVTSTTTDSQVSTAGPDSVVWGVTGLAVLLFVLCVALSSVVVVTRNRFVRRSSVPLSSSHGKKYKSEDV